MADMNQHPRSVRQIGNPERSCRVYLEDYAYVYVKRLSAEGYRGVRGGALYGRKIRQDGQDCYYIFGAVDVGPVWEEERLRFGQKAWKQMELQQKIYFPTMELCGWFVRGEEDFMPGVQQLQQAQDTYFAETGELVLTVTGEEGNFWRKGQSALYPLQGFYVFYQENTAMQEYMNVQHQERAGKLTLKKSAEPVPIKYEKNSDSQRALQAAEIDRSSPPSHPTWIQKMVEESKGKFQTEDTKGEVKREEKRSEERSEAPSSEGVVTEEASWKRRAVVVALFVLLAGGIVLYEHPEQAKNLQQYVQNLFGGAPVAEVGGTVSGVWTESEESKEQETESTAAESAGEPSSSQR